MSRDITLVPPAGIEPATHGLGNGVLPISVPPQRAFLELPRLRPIGARSQVRALLWSPVKEREPRPARIERRTQMPLIGSLTWDDEGLETDAAGFGNSRELATSRASGRKRGRPCRLGVLANPFQRLAPRAY
jgi:hypothetical protein